MVEKKSLLEFLDEVAKEEYMEDSVDLCRIHAIQDPETSVDHVFKEAGKRYVKQYLEIAAENAHISVKNHEEMDTLELVASRNESRRFEVNKSSIINTDIDV